MTAEQYAKYLQYLESNQTQNVQENIQARTINGANQL